MQTATAPASAWTVLEHQQLDPPPVLKWDQRGVIVAIDSEKGGVGKSGLAGGLIAVAAAAGHDVLAIDLDPRATLTAELGLGPQDDELDDDTFGGSSDQLGVNDVLYEDPKANVDELPELRGLAGQALRPAGEAWGGRVQVLAAERALANREADLTTPSLEHRLAIALDGVATQFSLAVIDLPPRAGGKLVGAGLLAATHVIYPATLNEDGFVGVRDALRTAKLITRSHPGKLRNVGVVRNIIERRTNLAELTDNKFIESYGDSLMNVVIPKRIIRQEARTACVPITAAAGRDAQDLVTAYTRVLNAINEVT